MPPLTMSMLEVFAAALFPLAGTSGLDLLRQISRSLVDPLGAELALVAERVDDTARFRPLAACRGDGGGGFIEDGFSEDDMAGLEARARALVGAPADATWRYETVGADAAVAVLVRGPIVEPLATSIALLAKRVSTELARLRSEERHRLASSAVGEIVWEWTVSSDGVRWDESVDSVFGHAPSNATTFDDWLSRVHPADRARVAKSLREVLAGRETKWRAEYRFVRGDGTIAFVRDRCVVVRAPDGRALKMIGALADITETKALEQRLILAERMAAMGTLAAGIAHEINNPLAYVKGNVEHVLHELRKYPAIDPDIFAALEEATEGAERVRRIVQDLRLFSRPQVGTGGACDVERVVESALAIANDDIRRCARIEKVFGNPPAVEANEAEVGHVVLILIVNALYAMRDGTPERNVLRIETGVDPSGRVFVNVSDTGTGIAADVLPRVFDPFFTTKEVGEGSGLGLAIAHSIVTSSGGEITVDSTPGAGSTFRVLLPASERDTSSVRTLSSDPPARRLRILFVDDDARLAAIVQRFLSRDHDVEIVTEGRDAIAKLKADRAFDAIVCDLSMPDVSGIDVYEEVVRAEPDLARRFVFLTGGVFTPRMQAFLAKSAQPVLEKPFGPAQLRRVLASMA